VAVIGGGDTAMEEATFLTRYAEHVTIIHRFDFLEASKIMQKKALSNKKISVLWMHEVAEAYGSEAGLEGTLPSGATTFFSRHGCGIRYDAPAACMSSLPSSFLKARCRFLLAGVKVVNKSTGEVSDLAISALFFAIGHSPATKFLDGQLELDDFGYIKCLPGSSETSVPGVFAAGDVKDPKYKQAVVAAGSGCIAALDAEHSLQALGGSHGSMSIDEIACSHWTSNVVPGFTGVQPRIAEQGVERAETGR